MKRQVPIFHGRITSDGKFELAENEKAYRLSYFKTLAGKTVEIVVRPERVKRSLDQNAYMHAVPFPMLAEELGYESIEELKYDLMGTCWGWTRTKSGHEIPVKPSTSQMTVEECTHFIDWLVKWAATPGNVCEHGFTIPLPNEAEAA